MVAAGGLAFVDSDDTLARVYHALKWSLPHGVALALGQLDGIRAIGGEGGEQTIDLRHERIGEARS